MNKLLKPFLFFGLIALASPSVAQVSIGINFGPPRARYEVRGESPMSGDIWIGGYYAYNDGRRNYDWVPGRWEAPPSPRQVWVAPRYRRNGDHYDYYQGSWKDGGHSNTYYGGRGRGNGNNNGRGNGNNNGRGNGRSNARGNDNGRGNGNGNGRGNGNNNGRGNGNGNGGNK